MTHLELLKKFEEEDIFAVYEELNTLFFESLYQETYINKSSFLELLKIFISQNQKIKNFDLLYELQNKIKNQNTIYYKKIVAYFAIALIPNSIYQQNKSHVVDLVKEVCLANTPSDVQCKLLEILYCYNQFDLFSDLYNSMNKEDKKIYKPNWIDSLYNSTLLKNKNIEPFQCLDTHQIYTLHLFQNCIDTVDNIKYHFQPTAWNATISKITKQNHTIQYQYLVLNTFYTLIEDGIHNQQIKISKENLNSIKEYIQSINKEIPLWEKSILTPASLLASAKEIEASFQQRVYDDIQAQINEIRSFINGDGDMDDNPFSMYRG